MSDSSRTNLSVSPSEIIDVVVVGAGVVGAAVFYSLARYSNVGRVVLVEKYDDAGKVNSDCNYNSQTLHFGDIETNYTVEKASRVKKGADMVANYVEQFQDSKFGDLPLKEEDSGRLFSKSHKMVLAVGKDEVSQLDKRFEEFKELFPKLEKIGREELAKIEPKIVEGRDPSEELRALVSPNGYSVDFGELARSFVKEGLKNSKSFKVYYNTEVVSVEKFDHSEDGEISFEGEKTVETYETASYYEIKIHDEVKKTAKVLKARLVVFATGSHSLGFAHDLGYGKEFSLLPVAGNFFRAKKKLLNGKVYTLQMKKLPFAAIHGDPHVLDPDETRFGPTAKMLPMLERGKFKTFFSFMRRYGFKFSSILSYFKILFDPILFKYGMKNFFYDFPYFGKRMFVKEVKKIIPSVKVEDFEFSKKIGGVRPQIVNVQKRKLQMGEAKILGKRLIFNITPSPGASTCLSNAFDDCQRVVEMLGPEFTFQKEKFEQELGKSI